MDQYFLYILYSHKIDKYYTGQTSNVESRLDYHNDISRNKIWTRRGIPWELKVSIPFSSRSAALKAERYLKNQKSRMTIETVIKDGWRGTG